ncbi:MAG TPA: UDP-N-acetylglucosamine 2-epimerase (non-hydrolyzing) [Ignavibacteriaceae bacterium]|nr:UDP-N-acetylglucosamine 2-epimerase (non-hydrolyzing) [Ignavibacteriaceae bacterium]
MKKILIVFGTRPEAIKLVPLINKLKKDKYFEVFVCSTGQHREMLKHVLDIFNVKLDFDLDLMKPNQDLYDITSNALIRMKEVLDELKPDVLVVQGDTTTAFTAALAAFYKKIKVAHVEAGLRSYNIFSPYPEEANRRFITVLTDFNFVPTNPSKKNLIKEGIDKKKIWMTGNTVIDTIISAKKLIDDNKELDSELKNKLTELCKNNIFDSKYILITLHRREKFGQEFRDLLFTIKKIAKKYPAIKFVYPVHLNPNVKGPVEEILYGIENIFLIEPLEYLPFIYLMKNCFFIMSDSGGIQEECFVFEKPIIVLRDVTERNEAIKAGYAFLTGTNEDLIINTFSDIVNKLETGFNYFNTKNPFGDGKASNKIAKVLKNHL